MREFFSRGIVCIFSIVVLLISYSIIKAQEEVPILFWGEGCPHCTEVKEEIDESSILSNMEIEYREIYNNKENARVFDQKVKECELSPYRAGVPMLYLEGTCWMGKYEVIEGLEASAMGESIRTKPEEQEQKVKDEIVEESEQEDLTIAENRDDGSVEDGGNTVLYILVFTVVVLLLLFVVILSSYPLKKSQNEN